MKRVITILLFSLIVSASFAGNTPDGMRISLITCTQGSGDVAAAFGHTAIRVVDSTYHRDIVFNYGTYSFEEPHFLLKFLRGDLRYMLSVNYFHQFVKSYQKEGRGVSEQVCNLTPAQKASIYSFLMDNHSPEKRFYLYDFLIDNCATRVRDLFDSNEFISPHFTTNNTFRDNLYIYLQDVLWLRLGIDLLLGQRVDRKMTYDEEMFLPCQLAHHLAEYYNPACKKGLMEDSVVIVPARERSGKWRPFFSFISQPVMVFSYIFIFYLILLFTNRRLLRKLSNVMYILLGVCGVILFFMWFGTNHIWTKCNWNLLWTNPLFLVPVFLKEGKVKEWAIYILSGIAILEAIFIVPLPQHLNLTIIPVALSLAVMVIERIITSKSIRL